MSQIHRYHRSSAERRISLGGAWEFYSAFYERALRRSSRPRYRRLELRPATRFTYPRRSLVSLKRSSVIACGLTKLELALAVEAPGDGSRRREQAYPCFPEGGRAGVLGDSDTGIGQRRLKKLKVQEVVVHASIGGKAIGEVRLRVMLRASAMAQ